MMFCWTSALVVSGITRERRNLVTNALVDIRNADAFEESMEKMGFSSKIKSTIQRKLDEVGFESVSELALLALDFKDRPEIFSELLKSDFGFDALMAHRTRAVVMDMCRSLATHDFPTRGAEGHVSEITTTACSNDFVIATELHTLDFDTNAAPHDPSAIAISACDKGTERVEVDAPLEEKMVYKKCVVNEQARRRRRKAELDGSQHDYGLPSNYREMFPRLSTELDEFYCFMTRPYTASQEEHIRPATANVYLRHAKLFIGWFVKQNYNVVDNSLSLFTIVPNKEKESANSVLEFVLWLRTSRSISVSYEANLLRGIAKLIKFRFAKESKSDPTYGDKPFDDVPMIREIRKLHRDANKRQTMAPRSSDENQKWLSWPEYLQVVRSVQQELLQLLSCYEEGMLQPSETGVYSAAGRKIATVYQYYLILAFFASVPDRQRTIRELELGKSFIKDTKQNLWTIKHSPDDYKTGKTYGDRPSLSLSPELVPAIDDFIERWRPCLRPLTDALFVQPRTRKPLTQDSVYQIVARNCYSCTGKRTNPHLLRDMIVTHIKESDASEKELEALALFMGHSINMQRNSYDRRSLTKKVAPAIQLIYSINNRNNS